METTVSAHKTGTKLRKNISQKGQAIDKNSKKHPKPESNPAKDLDEADEAQKEYLQKRISEIHSVLQRNLLQKLVQQNRVRFSILNVEMDAILLRLVLQKGKGFSFKGF